VSRRYLAMVLSVVVVAGAGVSCDRSPVGPPAGSTRISIDRENGETLDAIAMGDGPNVAIMSHGATGTKEGFYPLMPLLADVSGWRVIAYDAQGVGNSTGTEGSDRSGDLAAVVERARRDGAKRIALIGASQGAVVSLESVTDVEADGVVALSPYLAPQGGFEPRWGRSFPVMLAVAEDNEPYATAVGQLAAQLGIEPVIVTGDNHGAGMFIEHPELMDQVVAFLSERVGHADAST
jgi:alpha/beta superfamily hydrolase